MRCLHGECEGAKLRSSCSLLDLPSYRYVSDGDQSLDVTIDTMYVSYCRATVRCLILTIRKYHLQCQRHQWQQHS